tara:strand:- start:3221 stop:5257 length:2037 start_codon:yes stop_codon:yes gene_type:complete
MSHAFTNDLIHETSPYLLQHAHNPVNWEAWGPEVLARAKKEDKLLLISIGYAACHWCHVMEHECFEDEAVAKVMNDYFINIKIDREERPDVDHIYMDALQMMTGSGGWPLNIVALPDGRPFWGATYVQKANWMKVLEQLSELYRNDPGKVTDYAEDMATGIKAINLMEHNEAAVLFNQDQLHDVVKEWSAYFDTYLGGYKRAPKFMMPVNLNFLLHYGTVYQDDAILAYVHTTLTRMAWGGIFDHVGGGFSRYSVDAKWHVPHFEKMLYDNGQLISLYAQAYATTKKEDYRKTVERTVSFVERELMDKNHGFYSSLDADSLNPDGILEEGAFYVWQEEELKSLLGGHFDIFKDYFSINSYGFWEHGNYVLIRDAAADDIAKKHVIDVERLHQIIEECTAILKEKRDHRYKPRLDDKMLTSWNGLMLKGLVDAYRHLGNSEYLELALKNALFIANNLVKKDGGLCHNHKNGKSTINGYLEDFASVIDAYTGLYEVSFEVRWLNLAKSLTEYCLTHYFDPKSKLFFFTSKSDDYVIRRTIEVADNVVPASNSIMAKNLFRLAKFYPENDYAVLAQQMLRNMQEQMLKNAQSHANWLQLALLMARPFYEVAIVGAEAQQKAKELYPHYLPNTIIAGAPKDGDLALLRNRYIANETQIYVCEHGACRLPLTQTEKALTQLQF